MSKKNTRNFSLVALRKEKKVDDTHELFVAEIDEDVEITVKNPTKIDYYSLVSAESGDVSALGQIFEGLLTDEDHAALKATKPTVEELSALLEAASLHYAEENEEDSKS